MISWDSLSETPALARAGPLLGPLANELIVAPARPVMQRPRFLVWCQAARAGDEARVGVRTVGLGEVRGALARHGLPVPDGFATSADAFDLFLDSPVPPAAWRRVRRGLRRHDSRLLLSRTLRTAVRRLLCNPGASAEPGERGQLIRSLVCATCVPSAVQDAIRVGYRRLREEHGQDCEVAVRSSRVDEDPAAPLFGNPDEYAMGLRGLDDVIVAWRDRCASAFDEASVRAALQEGAPLPARGFGILIMTIVRSDLAVSGFVSTRDPGTRSGDAVHISASPGLGTAAAPGALPGDALVLAKEAIREAVRSGSRLEGRPESAQERLLGPDGVLRLGALALAVEERYGCPVRLEWARDGGTGAFMVLHVNPLEPRRGPRGTDPAPAPDLEPW